MRHLVADFQRARGLARSDQVRGRPFHRGYDVSRSFAGALGADCVQLVLKHRASLALL